MALDTLNLKKENQDVTMQAKVFRDLLYPLQYENTYKHTYRYRYVLYSSGTVPLGTDTEVPVPRTVLLFYVPTLPFDPGLIKN